MAGTTSPLDAIGRPPLDPGIAQHPLNAGLVCWLLGLPDFAFGSKWQNLVGPEVATLAGGGANPSTSWKGNSPVPGTRCLYSAGGANASRLDFPANTFRQLSGTTYTFALWVNAISMASQGMIFLEPTSGTDAFFQRYGSDQVIYVGGTSGTYSDTYTGLGTTWLTGKGWQHLVMTSNPTLGTRIYRNGAALSGGGGTGRSISTGGNPWRIGDVGQPAGGVNGMYAAQWYMTDIRIYNRALTATDAAALYYESLAGYPNVFGRRHGLGFTASGGGGTSISIADTGAGADTIAQILASLSIAETSAGSDATPAIGAAISAIDSVAGADADPSIGAAFTQSDSGQGTDSDPGIGAAAGITDSCAGADSLGSMLAALGITEAAAGSDALDSIAASLLLAETSSAADSISRVIASLSISDASLGNDGIAALQASLAALIDACVGNELITSGIIISVADQGAGSDADPQVTVSFQASDTCSGTDLLSAIAVLLQVIEAGHGTDVTTIITGGKITRITFTASSPWSIEFTAQQSRTITFTASSPWSIEFTAQQSRTITFTASSPWSIEFAPA
jgi:hypothetical protein